MRLPQVQSIKVLNYTNYLFLPSIIPFMTETFKQNLFIKNA